MRTVLWTLYGLLILTPLTLTAQKAPVPTDTLQTKILTPAAMQADFRYLRRLLEETHPGLYRYSSKAAMTARLDSIFGTLNQPMPFYDFYRTIAALMADIHCAHTQALPHKDFEKAFMTTWKTLPFFMIPIQNRSYVLFNGTTDQTVKPGFELLSINGRSMPDSQRRVARYYWADGYIQSSNVQVMQGQLFALFYYWFVDQSDSFSLTFRDLAGDTVRIKAPAQSFGTFTKTFRKNSVNKQMLAWYNRKKTKHPWRLSFPEDMPETALLRLDEFGIRGANSNETAVAKMRTFMDKTMTLIEKKKARNLIIDVRANPGGWDSQGIELFTYLMRTDTAVAYYARQHSIADSSEFLQFSDLSDADRKNVKNELIPEADGTFTLKQGSDTRTPKRYAPKPNRFRGKVYVLMNSRSFSTAAEFLAVAKANNVGVFVGEESGGVYEGGNGGSFVHLNLPNSNIQLNTPLVYYDNAVSTPKQKGRGTLPDYAVPIPISDILNHTDAQLDFVKGLLKTPQPPKGE